MCSVVGGGGGGGASLRGCAADTDRVFSNFGTVMGYKFTFSIFTNVYQLWYTDWLQIAYLCQSSFVQFGGL